MKLTQNSIGLPLPVCIVKNFCQVPGPWAFIPCSDPKHLGVLLFSDYLHEGSRATDPFDLQKQAELHEQVSCCRNIPFISWLSPFMWSSELRFQLKLNMHWTSGWRASSAFRLQGRARERKNKQQNQLDTAQTDEPLFWCWFFFSTSPDLKLAFP